MQDGAEAKEEQALWSQSRLLIDSEKKQQPAPPCLELWPVAEMDRLPHWLASFRAGSKTPEQLLDQGRSQSSMEEAWFDGLAASDHLLLQWSDGHAVDGAADGRSARGCYLSPEHLLTPQEAPAEALASQAVHPWAASVAEAIIGMQWSAVGIYLFDSWIDGELLDQLVHDVIKEVLSRQGECRFVLPFADADYARVLQRSLFCRQRIRQELNLDLWVYH